MAYAVKGFFIASLLAKYLLGDSKPIQMGIHHVHLLVNLPNNSDKSKLSSLETGTRRKLQKVKKNYKNPNFLFKRLLPDLTEKQGVALEGGGGAHKVKKRINQVQVDG